MHVTHFIQRYPPAIGGSEAYFARLSRYLARQGHQVTVHTTAAMDLEAFWSKKGRCLATEIANDEGVTVQRHGLARWPGRRWLLKMLSLVPVRRWQCLTLPCNPVSFEMWRKTSRCQGPLQLVHVSAFPYTWPIVCGLRLARRRGVPFLLTPFLHLGDVENRRDPTRRAYLSPALTYLLFEADRIFVQTETERRALRELGIEDGKIILQGLGVAAEECTGGNRAQALSEWKVADGGPVIGHLANNSEEKGTVDLLKAAELLWDSGFHFHIVLAGPEMPNFIRFWKRYRFRERVRRLGVLSGAQKRDFFAGLDFFALPSRSDSFGLVLLEAWANGLPNVAYQAGGPGELIHDSEDGLLASCGDIAGLAACIRRLLKDTDLARTLGQAGRKRTEREFRWEDKLDLVQDVYAELIERNFEKKSLELRS